MRGCVFLSVPWPLVISYPLLGAAYVLFSKQAATWLSSFTCAGLSASGSCRSCMMILATIPKDASENSSAQLTRYDKRLVDIGISSEEANLLTRDINFILLKKVRKDKPKRVVLSEYVSSIAKGQSTKKLPNPGSFVLDCSISTSRFIHSLCDLGSSINLMPKSVAERLGMTNYKPTRIAPLRGSLQTSP